MRSILLTSFLNIVVNVKLNVINSFVQADIGIFEISMQTFVSFRNIYTRFLKDAQTFPRVPRFASNIPPKTS